MNLFENKIKDIRNRHQDGVYFYADLLTGEHLSERGTYLPEELDGENVDILSKLYQGVCVKPSDMGKVVNLYERIVQGMKEPIYMDELAMQIYLKNRQGKMQLFSVICYLETNQQGLVIAYVGKIRAMKKKELEEREILSQSIDERNSRIFMKKVEEFQAVHPERKYAYIQFDIRKFRYINDTYGAEAGDAILQYITDTLKVMCNDSYLYSRMTSDIYAIVTYYNGKEELLEFIEQLDYRLHRCGDIRFNMSYGVKIVDGTDTRFRKNGDEAGLARKQVKHSILKKVAFYEDVLTEKMVSAGSIEEIEEEALKNNEFHVYLQPKYRYDKVQATIVGAEALVRWIDADGKIKSPMEFIPVFEENGFILKLDQYMWEEVCKILRRWINEGKTPVPISVNISRSYLEKFDAVAYIKKLVEIYQLPIDLLELEITETTESDETVAYAKEFKEAGFTLMMDDFGSGYSSLSMLKDTPFDVLKMDRFFLDECLENEQGKTIVSHVISMSDDLGLNVVAEGVETKEIADFLYDKGCYTSQGYYFSKPVSVEEFEKMVFDK